MITREEAIQRLENVTREIIELKKALEEGWEEEETTINSTQVFLQKCVGWEDTRTPEEIIADIYAARTVSDRGTTAFEEKSS